MICVAKKAKKVYFSSHSSAQGLSLIAMEMRLQDTWGNDKCIYYMASSASGQYATNSVFWLATRAGKMERYCPPGTARQAGAFADGNYFLLGKNILLWFLCLYGTRKSINENENKEKKMLMSFKNTFCNRNRQTQKFVLNLKIWIWNLNLECNQSNDCIFCIYPIRV